MKKSSEHKKRTTSQRHRHIGSGIGIGENHLADGPAFGCLVEVNPRIIGSGNIIITDFNLIKKGIGFRQNISHEAEVGAVKRGAVLTVPCTHRGIIGGGSGSWHQEYKDSAWVFLGGLPYELTEGDVICMFSQYGEVSNRKYC